MIPPCIVATENSILKVSVYISVMGSLLCLFEDYPVTAIKDKRTVDWNNTSCSGSITRLIGFDTAPVQTQSLHFGSK